MLQGKVESLILIAPVTRGYDHFTPRDICGKNAVPACAVGSYPGSSFFRCRSPTLLLLLLPPAAYPSYSYAGP